MVELCLHLGMSKTATTWLQKNIFPRLLDDTFFDNPASRLLEGGRWQGTLARAFRRSPKIWRHMGDTLLRDMLGQSGAKALDFRSNILVSDQSAGPRLFEFGEYVGPHWERERMDPTMLCAHLKAMRHVAESEGFTALKVMLVIRRQDRWLASKYAQRSDRIVGASQRDFEARIRYYTEESYGYYADGIVLDYCTLWDMLVEALGETHVLIIPYEQLARDPLEFLDRLCHFHAANTEGADPMALASLAAKLPANVRATAPDTWRLRAPTRRALLRSLTRSEGMMRLLHWANLQDREIHLTEPVRRQILGTYSQSNAALGARIGYDLQQFGYVE